MSRSIVVLGDSVIVESVVAAALGSEESLLLGSFFAALRPRLSVLNHDLFSSWRLASPWLAEARRGASVDIVRGRLLSPSSNSPDVDAVLALLSTASVIALITDASSPLLSRFRIPRRAMLAAAEPEGGELCSACAKTLVTLGDCEDLRDIEGGGRKEEGALDLRLLISRLSAACSSCTTASSVQRAVLALRLREVTLGS